MGYEESKAGDETRTAFRIAEKKYKRYKEATTVNRRKGHRSNSQKIVPQLDLKDVLDFWSISPDSGCSGSCSIYKSSSLEEHPVYEVEGRPGFLFIPNALSKDQQRQLVAECLTDYLTPPNRTNHNAQHGPIWNLWSSALRNDLLLMSDDSIGTKTSTTSTPVTDKESSSSQIEDQMMKIVTEPVTSEWSWVPKDHPSAELSSSVAATSLLRRLRWITLGTQFDWSKRAYNINLPFREFPASLAKLASRLAQPAMKENEQFKAEAAIVNFYGPGDTLGGHVDDMEADWSKPIVSLSLGCTGIFMIGGKTRDEDPLAMFVRSGDVVLMCGEARECFHGVPRIFVGEDAVESVVEEDTSLFGEFSEFMKRTRININVRQVW